MTILETKTEEEKGEGVNFTSKSFHISDQSKKRVVSIHFEEVSGLNESEADMVKDFMGVEECTVVTKTELLAYIENYL